MLRTGVGDGSEIAGDVVSAGWYVPNNRPRRRCVTVSAYGSDAVVDKLLATLRTYAHVEQAEDQRNFFGRLRGCNLDVNVRYKGEGKPVIQHTTQVFRTDPLAVHPTLLRHFCA